MPGVQSFVAQRQQDYQIPSRQLLGAQNRVPIPVTKLEYTKDKPSFQRLDPSQPADPPADPPITERSTHSSRQQSTKAPVVQDLFETDAEGFDDSTTISIDGSSRGDQGVRHQDELSSRYGTDHTNSIIAGNQASFRHEQEQPYRIPRSLQLDAEDSAGEDDEGSYEEVLEEENEEEPEESVVRDGILQDLNSPGFSQYLQEETSHATGEVLRPVKTTWVAHTNLVVKDSVQYSQNPANPFTSMEYSMNSGVADLGVRRRKDQTLDRATNKTSRTSAQQSYVRSVEQPLISARSRRISDDHKSSQQPSVTSYQNSQPTGVARNIAATNEQSQANEENRLSTQKGSITHGDSGYSVEWGSDFDRRHNREIVASGDSQQTRKRIRDLDYSPEYISRMTFQQLTNEPFNLSSDTARACIPQELPMGSLDEKIDYVLENLRNDDTKLVQRRAFFSSLSLEQYEECASLIVHRFSAIILKVTDARQQRRRAAKEFENEVAKRERCVRGKTAVVDQDLDSLKRGGEEVVRRAAL